MTRHSRPHLLRFRDPHDEHGQVVVLFALVLIVLIAFTGLLIDGGLAWGNRRQAQGAADTAALAAATTITSGGKLTDVRSAAQSVAAANGYGVTNSTDCSGSPLPGNVGNGIQVNNPPVSPDPHAGDTNYVEVIVTRAMHTAFSSIVGQSCWLVSARAVAVAASSSVASCSFCALNSSSQNHTLLLQNGAKLRVDGDIYTNSSSGGTSGTCVPSSWKVCGDAFDVFGTPETPPAYISAKTISTVGGWETHDQNIVTADSRLTPPACPYTADPPNQKAPYVPSNVCIHMPAIVDPYATVPAPTLPTRPTSASCPSGTAFPATTGLLTIGTGTQTLCPGLYPGGIKITGSETTAILLSGIYYIQTGGFAVVSGASVDGSAGVMIYNAGTGAVKISQLPNATNTVANPDLVLVTTNPYDVKNPSINAGPNPADVTHGAVQVKYTFTVKAQGAPAPQLSDGDKIDFYDGEVPISGCSFSLAPGSEATFTVQCPVTYTSDDVGIHGIAAIFYGDPKYNDYEGVVPGPHHATQPGEIVKITGVIGGTTLLSPMKSGPYKGFVIFQAGSDTQNMLISPQSALATCETQSLTWMTDGVPTTPEAGNKVPQPCGDLGGISGTIYSQPPGGNLANATAQVQITASGLADLQVVAGKILVTSGADARFAFTPTKFALGGIRLVE